ncbi:helix-turn-helix domain-containing protein [Erwiniaceae bacterium BAC15a-03b]|uniref:Helix-turn-helix domain-containing protein n=1 Tax=Winslowiella arboricola TaxID=2978220 RepID=A0A9J6Q0Q8_9GAMM|nr:helix-turn-helix domain-containing protein [Winslowiella arboricola]MCU5772282.1 helix-turn-helix domain-containing protein [Winslowiella arboricola]MCU5779839.1 helix-turn-helix domain-containing protein [Winslowiella arboricola]
MQDYVIALEKVINTYFPTATFSVATSDSRFDDLIQDNEREMDESNENFILTHSFNAEELVIEAICLYIDSLIITIKRYNHCCSENQINGLLNEIKIYLFAEILQQQKKMFRSISDNTWHLASGLSHKLITQHVVDGALKTIPFSDAVIFRIYDEDKNLLIPIALSGFKDNYYDYAVSPQESLSGQVFASRQSVTLNSREAIIGSVIRQSALRASVMENNPIASSLVCVPVQDKQICYGTLTLLSFSRHSIFNSLAVSLLETFASQVALAWRNAKIHDEKVSSLNEVDALRKQLEQQNAILKGSVEFHNEMINLSTRINNLNSFIAAICERVNLNAGYIDILGNRLDATVSFPYHWDDLTRSFAVESGFANGDYFIQPLKHDELAVGFFILPADAVNDATRLILSRLGDFIVMQIMRKASSLTLEHKRKSALIEQLFSRGITSETEQNFARYGFQLQNWIICLRLETEDSVNQDVTSLVTLNKLNTLLSRRNSFSFADSTNITVYISDLHTVKLKEFTDRISRELPLIIISKAGISDVVKRSECKLAWQQASTALEVLKTRKKEGVLLFHNTGIERLFINHQAEDLKRFVADVLTPLIEGGEKNAILLLTLNSYIYHRCSTINSAAALNIHVNTLYQRVRKIENMIGMNLNHPDDFLIVTLACHINKLYHA